MRTDPRNLSILPRRAGQENRNPRVKPSIAVGKRFENTKFDRQARGRVGCDPHVLWKVRPSSNNPRTILERPSGRPQFPGRARECGQRGRATPGAGREVAERSREDRCKRSAQAWVEPRPGSQEQNSEHEGAEPGVYAAFNARNRAGVVAPRLGLPAAAAAAEVNLGNYPRLPVARRSWARAWAMVLFLISTSSALSEAEIWVLSSSCWAAPRSI